MNTSKAKSKAKSKKTETKEREYIEVRSAGVSSVRVAEGKNGDLIFFTLCLNGVYINNCRVVEGKNGDFITWPQYKGSDNQYYNTVYCALSDEDTKKILDQVQAELDK